jgi:glutathione peroxidase
MIVNTASKCGLTPQYKDLEAIYKEYKDKGFVIVGFPAILHRKNREQMRKLLLLPTKLRCDFPMMDKVSVKEMICVRFTILNKNLKRGARFRGVEFPKIPNQ